MVAAGHPATAEAGVSALRRGGNACDAAVCAMLAACVAEPCLASLAGGGFLLWAPPQGPATVFDFFCQTPSRKRAGGGGLFAIESDFGTTSQEFHIGAASVATPGVIPGFLTIQRQACRLPIADLAGPAVTMARDGVRVSNFQAYVIQVLQPILDSTPESRTLYAGADQQRLRAGDTFRSTGLSDYLQGLSGSTPENWWQHPGWETACADIQRDGGHLSMADLENYQVVVREPLKVALADMQLTANPFPALGGGLIAAGLLTLAQSKTRWRRLDLLLEAMQTMNALRADPAAAAQLPEAVAGPLARWQSTDQATRGTSHISATDRWGGLAALTLSNGEGSGLVVPDTGVMLNNMLGEEDLQPDGIGTWTEDRRLGSMMAPSIVESPRCGRLALGSGGSNRIRTAMLQVIAGLADQALTPEEAVSQPRCHLDQHRTLHLETDLFPDAEELASSLSLGLHRFRERSMYFGGVQIAGENPEGKPVAAADPRRGGAVAIA